MIKKITLCLHALCMMLFITAQQAPQSVNYQAVARKSDGTVWANHFLALRFTIRDNAPGGTQVYTEKDTATTNQFGLFTVAIGGVSPLGFSSIDWGAASKFLEVEMDPAGGTAYTSMGNTQMLSVPYALYAETAGGNWGLNGNAGTGGNGNFIGTTDPSSLIFRVNNQRAGLLLYDSNTASTSFGYQALNYGGPQHNTAFGYRALSNTYSGGQNVAVGYNAMRYNTGGNANVAIGSGALNQTTDGQANIAIGSQPMIYDIKGSDNIAIGTYALLSDTAGKGNIAIGNSALDFSPYSNYNVVIGYNAMAEARHGSYNIAIGDSALKDNSTATGSNIAIGYRSVMNNTTGVDNVGIGITSLFAATTETANTALGDFTGNLQAVTNATLLGYNADVNASGYSNVTALGYGALVTGNTMVRVGNGSMQSIGGSVGWSTVSDGRFKRNVQQNIPGISFIKQLRPVTYTLDIHAMNSYLGTGADEEAEKQKDEKAKASDEAQAKAKEAITYSGFIAQEVEAAARKTGYDFSGVDAPKNDKDIYGLRYADFVPTLVKAIQEQQVIIEQHDAMLAQYNKTVQGLNETILKLQREVDGLKAK